jgi:hypothetical protein
MPGKEFPKNGVRGAYAPMHPIFWLIYANLVVYES